MDSVKKLLSEKVGKRMDIKIRIVEAKTGKELSVEEAFDRELYIAPDGKIYHFSDWVEEDSFMVCYDNEYYLRYIIERIVYPPILGFTKTITPDVS